MAHKGYSFNEFGTKVSEHICDSCGRYFNICPAVSQDKEGFENCMDVACESYDAQRDADKLFDEELILKEKIIKPC